MRRVLITGGQGMLATDLAAQLSGTGRYEVFPLSHQALDVTDATGVQETVARLKPDAVVHTASLHVDWCEAHPEDTFRVNAWGTRILARACEAHAATLVYISTCGLFGDEYRAYTEYDPVVLKTVYARSKYAGEEFVRQFCERHFIVRPGWLFGGSIHHAKNFVFKRYEEARNVTVVRSVHDKHGSPTYTSDLAGGIEQLLDTDEYGVYHLSNQGGCFRADYVRQIIRCFGLPTAVEEVDSSHYPRKANVPNCEILCNLNSKFIRIPDLPPWEEAIERYIRALRVEMRT